jgi:hypothetical protein
MRKTLLLLLLVFSAHTFLSAQTLQTERRTLVVKHSEDWCPTCGTWGWDIYDSLVKRQTLNPSYKAYNVTLHVSSNWNALNAPNLDNLIINTMPFPIVAVPSFCVDNLDMDSFNELDFGGDQDNIEDTLIRPAIDSILYYITQEVSQTANVGVGFTAKIIAPDSLLIKTRVKTLVPLNGEYRIAVYVAEDSLYGFQQDLPAGSGWHRYTLKDAVEGGVWGKLLFTGAIAANQEFYHSFKMKIPSGWTQSHLRYYAIVYKRNTSTGFYEIENVTNKSTEPTGLEVIENEAAFDIYPIPAKDELNISYDGAGSELYSVAMYGMEGRFIAELYNGKLPATAIALPKVPAGTYILKLSSRAGAIVKKINVQP